MSPLWKSRKSRQNPGDGFAVPRHLFFLWDFLGNDAPLPAREQHVHDAFLALNPGWSINVYSPEFVESAITGHPYESLYHGLPRGIQRCDIARPLMLEKFGGVYSDLDVQPRHTLDQFCGKFPDAGVILVEEVTLTRASSIRRGNRHPIRHGRPELRVRVANFWMASVPGHPFWGDVLSLMKERSRLEVRTDYDVIYTTGPDIISEVYERTRDKYDDVVLVPRRTARRFLQHDSHASWRGQDEVQDA